MDKSLPQFATRELAQIHWLYGHYFENLDVRILHNPETPLCYDIYLNEMQHSFCICEEDILTHLETLTAYLQGIVDYIHHDITTSYGLKPFPKEATF